MNNLNNPPHTMTPTKYWQRHDNVYVHNLLLLMDGFKQFSSAISILTSGNRRTHSRRTCNGGKCFKSVTVNKSHINSTRTIEKITTHLKWESNHGNMLLFVKGFNQMFQGSRVLYQAGSTLEKSSLKLSLNRLYKVNEDVIYFKYVQLNTVKKCFAHIASCIIKIKTTIN